jgi:putative addiction module killer protein
MFQVETTSDFDSWLDGLRDRMAQKRIVMRIARVRSGLLGDWKPVGDGVSELRIDYGPGYRLFYAMRDQFIVILLCGSDKGDQDRSIALAKDLAKRI